MKSGSTGRASIANALWFVWLILVLWLPLGCSDGAGDGGFGGLGTLGGERTAGAVLYVANSGSNDVSAYTMNPTTGVLTPMTGSQVLPISAPSAIVTSSNGLFAYVANRDTNNVTAFRVGTDGALLPGPSTSGNPNQVAAGTEPRALAISPDSQFLFVVNSGSDDVTVFKIGSAGVLTRVPQSTGPTMPVAAGASSPFALALAPTGRFLYVADSASNTITVFQVDTAGLLTLVPPAGSGTNPIASGGTEPTALALSPNGRFLYVTDGTSGRVSAFQVQTSGLLTLIPPASANPVSTGGTTPNSLTVAPGGAHLYIANGGDSRNVAAFAIGSDGLLTLVQATGATANPTPLPPEVTPVALTISQDGRFLYVANRGINVPEGTVSAYTIVSGSGTLGPLATLTGSSFRAGTAPSAVATFTPTP